MAPDQSHLHVAPCARYAARVTLQALTARSKPLWPWSMRPRTLLRWTTSTSTRPFPLLLGRINGMPESWTASDQEKLQKRNARQQAAQAQQQREAAAGNAAMENAKTKAVQAGRLPPEAQTQAPLPAPSAQ